MLTAAVALAQDNIEVAGRQVAVISDATGSASLDVDGAVLVEGGVIPLDPTAQIIGGVPVVAGPAGVGGNACGAGAGLPGLRRADFRSGLW